MSGGCGVEWRVGVMSGGVGVMGGGVRGLLAN